MPCTTHDSRRLRIPSLPTTRRASSVFPLYALRGTLIKSLSLLTLPFDFQIAKGLVLGAIYLTSGRTNAFSPSNVAVLTLLAQQSSISITNARLFRKLQRATQANIRMIDQQKKALEEARRSREEALKATKVRLESSRTPSSSFADPLFYADKIQLPCLDVPRAQDSVLFFLRPSWSSQRNGPRELVSFSLSASLLIVPPFLLRQPQNQEQREFVSTAQQSCELLLEIIDSLLDYSKLEAGAVKLEVIAFNPEEILADCCELLMVQAAKKGLQVSCCSKRSESIPRRC